MALEIIILRGVSGSGKTTLAHKEFSAALKVSADRHMVDHSGGYRYEPSRLKDAHGACFFEALSWAKNVTDGRITESGHPESEQIVVDNTNVTLHAINPYILLGDAYSIPSRIITLLCDPREAAARSVHNVPERVVLELDRTLRQVRLPPYWIHETRTV